MDDYRLVNPQTFDRNQVHIKVEEINSLFYLNWSLLNDEDLRYVQSWVADDIVAFEQEGVVRSTARVSAAYTVADGLQLAAAPTPALIIGQNYTVGCTRALPAGGRPGVDNGHNGWTPVPGDEVKSNGRAVLKVVDWEGGTGPKPATGYIATTGIVADINAALELPTGSRGSKWTTGDAFPTEKVEDDFHLFTVAVASGLSWYLNETTTTVKTDAALGDLALWNGERWVYEGNILGAATGLNQAQVDARVDLKLIPVNARIASNVSFIFSASVIPSEGSAGQVLWFRDARDPLPSGFVDEDGTTVTAALVDDIFEKTGDNWKRVYRATVVEEFSYTFVGTLADIPTSPSEDDILDITAGVDVSSRTDIVDSDGNAITTLTTLEMYEHDGTNWVRKQEAPSTSTGTGLPSFATETAYAQNTFFIDANILYKVITAIADTNTQTVAQLLAANTIQIVGTGTGSGGSNSVIYDADGVRAVTESDLGKLFTDRNGDLWTVQAIDIPTTGATGTESEFTSAVDSNFLDVRNTDPQGASAGNWYYNDYQHEVRKAILANGQIIFVHVTNNFAGSTSVWLGEHNSLTEALNTIVTYSSSNTYYYYNRTEFVVERVESYSPPVTGHTEYTARRINIPLSKTALYEGVKEIFHPDTNGQVTEDDDNHELDLVTPTTFVPSESNIYPIIKSVFHPDTQAGIEADDTGQRLNLLTPEEFHLPAVLKLLSDNANVDSSFEATVASTIANAQSFFIFNNEIFPVRGHGTSHGITNEYPVFSIVKGSVVIGNQSAVRGALDMRDEIYINLQRENWDNTGLVIKFDFAFDDKSGSADASSGVASRAGSMGDDLWNLLAVKERGDNTYHCMLGVDPGASNGALKFVEASGTGTTQVVREHQYLRTTDGESYALAQSVDSISTNWDVYEGFNKDRNIKAEFTFFQNGVEVPHTERAYPVSPLLSGADFAAQTRILTVYINGHSVPISITWSYDDDGGANSLGRLSTTVSGLDTAQVGPLDAIIGFYGDSYTSGSSNPSHSWTYTDTAYEDPSDNEIEVEANKWHKAIMILRPHTDGTMRTVLKIEKNDGTVVSLINDGEIGRNKRDLDLSQLVLGDNGGLTNNEGVSVKNIQGWLIKRATALTDHPSNANLAAWVADDSELFGQVTWTEVFNVDFRNLDVEFEHLRHVFPTFATGTAYINKQLVISADEIYQITADVEATNALSISQLVTANKAKKLTLKESTINTKIATAQMAAQDYASQFASTLAHWDGTVCPIGGILRVDINTRGSGYTSVPTVSFTPHADDTIEVTATATAVRNASNQIVRIDVTNGGVGYTKPPTVVISGGNGSGATAAAIVPADANIFEPTGTVAADTWDNTNKRWRVNYRTSGGDKLRVALSKSNEHLDWSKFEYLAHCQQVAPTSGDNANSSGAMGHAIGMPETGTFFWSGAAESGIGVWINRDRTSQKLGGFIHVNDDTLGNIIGAGRREIFGTHILKSTGNDKILNLYNSAVTSATAIGTQTDVFIEFPVTGNTTDEDASNFYKIRIVGAGNKMYIHIDGTLYVEILFPITMPVDRWGPRFGVWGDGGQSPGLRSYVYEIAAGSPGPETLLSGY